MNAPTAKLVILEGSQSGKVFELKGPTVIGRVAQAGIQITDNKISREHSKIYPQGSEFCIVDLNSSNGTLVNDAPVTKRLLKDGDEILLGATRFRFEAPTPDEDPPIETAKPLEDEPVFKEVVDLSSAPPATPVGAIRADQIVVKDKALQFSRVKGRKKPSLLFDDLGQRNFAYTLAAYLVVACAFVGFLLLGLYLGGVIGH